MTDVQWAGWCSVFERNFLAQPGASIIGRDATATGIIYRLQLGESVVEKSFLRPNGFGVPNPLETARQLLCELGAASAS